MNDLEDLVIGEKSWKNLVQTIEKDGYREGHESGRKESFQNGFDQGYKEGYESAFKKAHQNAVFRVEQQFCNSPSKKKVK